VFSGSLLDWRAGSADRDRQDLEDVETDVQHGNWRASGSGGKSISSSSPITHHQYDCIDGHQYCCFGLLGKMMQQIINNLSQNEGPTWHITFFPFIFPLDIFSLLPARPRPFWFIWKDVVADGLLGKMMQQQQPLPKRGAHMTHHIFSFHFPS